MNGHVLYDRFDGQAFEYHGNCTYILTKPCGSDDSFQVSVENEVGEDKLPRTRAVLFLLQGKVGDRLQMGYYEEGFTKPHSAS